VVWFTHGTGRAQLTTQSSALERERRRIEGEGEGERRRKGREGE
jgi:hypothetical protein